MAGHFRYRQAAIEDLPQLKALGVKAWSAHAVQFEGKGRDEFLSSIYDKKTYEDLLKMSRCIVCESDAGIIGMSFLVSNGNLTDVYNRDWAYIRFVSVDPDFAGNGIGRELTKRCIGTAKQNGEKIIALHTAEFMHAAIHIYESLGFSFYKELPPRSGKRYGLYLLQL